MGAMQPQAKDHSGLRGLPGAGRAEEGSSPRAWGGKAALPADTLTSRFWPSELR